MKVCGCVYGLLVIVVLQALASDAGGGCPLDPFGNTTTLLDSYSSIPSPPSNWTVVGAEGDSRTWEVSNSGQCLQTIATCGNASAPQENWLVTPFINTASIPEISVFVEFDCPASPSPDPSPDSCNTDFSLHVYHTSVVSEVESVNFIKYVEVRAAVSNNTRIPIPSSSDGLYIAFMDISACVEITRVQVVYTQCPEVVNALALYPSVPNGMNATGVCVEGAIPLNGGPLVARCRFEPDFYDFTSAGTCQCGSGREIAGDMCTECQQGFFKSSPGNSACLQCPDNSNNVDLGSTSCDCDEGYRRIDLTGGMFTCSECVPDFFLSGSGVCTACPTDSTSGGGTVAECNCASLLATTDGSFTTSGLQCDSCRTNYYRTASDQCVTCPSMSSRNFDDDQTMCMCDNNRATSGNVATTLGLDCDGCVAAFFNNATSGTECAQCPSNSMSDGFAARNCVCNDGTRLLSGVGSTTTFEPCSGCDANYFRLGVMCDQCPANSVRLLSTDDESRCSCISGDYRRKNSTNPREDCLPIAGFSSDILILNEGNRTINISLSAPSSVAVNVPITSEDELETVNFMNNVNILAGSRLETLSITSPDNTVALNENISFSLTILSTPTFVVGGITTEFGQLYDSTTITIQDDDSVAVGFTEGSVTFNESMIDPTLTITRVQSIASDFQLRITGAQLPLLDFSGVNVSKDEASVTVPFNIMKNAEGGEEDKVIILQLEYNGPPHFRPFVKIGAGGTYSEITITIQDDDPVPSSSFPLEAIIGVCAGAAGLAVLLLIIIILCLCICRLRVNRQGFYPTYEDKTSEPPTMLRYSASLRSISSQTVIPVTEGRSVPKENEFYV